jgi:hypothetical protein
MNNAYVEYPKFSFKGRTLELNGNQIRIYDADTIFVPISIEGVMYTYSCRLLGYDGPEKRPKKSDLNTLSSEE